MVTLSVTGELSPRGIADVFCNGKKFCEMYMDRHGNTLLRDPGGMDTALWELYRSISPEPEAYGNFPEDTLKKAAVDLNSIFSTVGAYATQGHGSGGVVVTLGFSVEGEVDESLLDHMGQTMEMMAQRMLAEGIATPDDEDERILRLESVASTPS